jgi:outer membrane protein OmpA-like peptidoglycan-associated protein
MISRKPKTLALLAVLTLPAWGSLYAQDQDAAQPEVGTVVTGMPPADLAGLAAGPEIKGMISARKDDKVQVTLPDGSKTVLYISEGTQVRSSSGLLGIGRSKLATEQLLNGLPVTAKTVVWGGGLIASQIRVQSKDLKTASMIRTGTEQGFSEQTAATEALRSRVADIDQYNVKGTTNVYFDTGKWNLSQQAQADLCAAASQANATDNALMLVVGYTDSVGDYDYNQTLSEKRASRVVNHLQQACGWKPYRMLTPTGMAEADPTADNSTEEGKAQNRRVAVNILVSKSVDGL